MTEHTAVPFHRTILCLLLMLLAATSGIAIVVYMGTQNRLKAIPDHMQMGSASFILEEARPAEQMVEIMYKTVKRAAFVPSTPQGPHKGLICLESFDGKIEVFRFYRKNGHNQQIVERLKPSKYLDPVMPDFCNNALTQLE